jgi:hypothetical protein
MKNFWSKLVRAILAVIFVLAALANIAVYLETSTKWPKVVAMLSSMATPETLTFVYRSLFLFVAALGFWWLNRRLEIIEGKVWELEGSKEPYVSLKPNEIIHPSVGGVLWKWDKDIGAAGPFCPLHRDPLFYKNYLRAVKPEVEDDDFLGTLGWFVCPMDDSKEFKFYERGSTQVRVLRAEAAARFPK